MKVRYDQRKIEFCFLILRLRIVNEYRGEHIVTHVGGHLNGEKANNYLELLRKKKAIFTADTLSLVPDTLVKKIELIRIT